MGGTSRCRRACPPCRGGTFHRKSRLGVVPRCRAHRPRTQEPFRDAPRETTELPTDALSARKRSPAPIHREGERLPSFDGSRNRSRIVSGKLTDHVGRMDRKRENPSPTVADRGLHFADEPVFDDPLESQKMRTPTTRIVDDPEDVFHHGEMLGSSNTDGDDVKRLVFESLDFGFVVADGSFGKGGSPRFGELVAPFLREVGDRNEWRRLPESDAAHVTVRKGVVWS